MTVPPPRSNPKRAVWTLAALLLLGGYVGSFFALRKTLVNRALISTAVRRQAEVGLADPAPNERLQVRLHYFSRDKSLHATLYYFYWPVHRWLGGDARLLDEGGAALEANPKLLTGDYGFYVGDPAQLQLEPSSPTSTAGAGQ